MVHSRKKTKEKTFLHAVNNKIQRNFRFFPKPVFNTIHAYNFSLSANLPEQYCGPKREYQLAQSIWDHPRDFPDPLKRYASSAALSCAPNLARVRHFLARGTACEVHKLLYALSRNDWRDSASQVAMSVQKQSFVLLPCFTLCFGLFKCRTNQ